MFVSQMSKHQYFIYYKGFFNSFYIIQDIISNIKLGMNNPEEGQLDITVSTKIEEDQVQSFVISIEKESTLNDLKLKLSQQTKIPIKAQAIYLSNKQLFNQHAALSQIGINAENSSIDLVVIDYKPFLFNNLKKEISQDCTFEAINHRRIWAGLILYSVCNNSKCKVFNQQCCINKKMGKFAIGVQIHKCKCPICGAKTSKAYKLSYFRCNIIIEGIKQDGEEFKYQGRAQGRQIKSFVHSDKEMSKWDHIEVTTSQL